MLGQPRDRLGARRVEHDAAGVHEEHAIGSGEWPRRPLLGDEHGARQALDQVEERLGGLRVELRRRLVEQQQPGPEGERRREPHALQLAGGELCDGALGEVLGSDVASASSTRGQISARLDPGVLEPERDLVRTRLITTWSSGSWKTEATDPARRGPRSRVSIPPTSHGRRRRRRGSAARGRRARAAASTCRRGRAEEGDVLAVVDL